MIEQPHKKLARQLSQIALKFIEKRPLLVWGGALVLMLSVANTASTRLIAPGPIELERVEVTTPPKPIKTEVPPPPKQQGTEVNSLPVEVENSQNNGLLLALLLGAIAVGCGGGCWLISKKLLYLHQRHQFSKPPKPKRRTQSLNRRETSVVRSRSVALAVSPQPLQQPPQHRTVARKVEQKIPTIPEPTVTVMPAEEFHPLDWNENNLAEMMDIRKRHSLSYVIRKSN